MCREAHADSQHACVFSLVENTYTQFLCPEVSHKSPLYARPATFPEPSFWRASRRNGGRRAKRGHGEPSTSLREIKQLRSGGSPGAPRLPVLSRIVVRLCPTHQPEKVRVCGRGGLPKAPVNKCATCGDNSIHSKASISAAKRPPILLLSAATPYMSVLCCCPRAEIKEQVAGHQNVGEIGHGAVTASL